VLKRPTAAVLLAGVAVVAIAPAAATKPTDSSHSAYVRVVECLPSDLGASFYGRMYRVPNTASMWMRFTLLERAGGPSFRPLRVPALARWRKTQTGLPAYGYRQGVRNLAKSAEYRVRVDFRWYDEQGGLLRRERHRSGICPMAGPRPNLRVRVLRASATRAPGVVRYVVRALNDGTAPADSVPVRLSVDHSEVNTKTLPLLSAGTASLLAFRGPECRRQVTARVDPRNEIAESSEADNVHTVACAKLPR
jgi:hypothetical protein